jgi:hypothetical protein
MIGEPADPVDATARAPPRFAPQRHARRPHGRADAADDLAVPSGARPLQPLRARDKREASKMNGQGALSLLPLLTLHRTWQHLQGLEHKERSRSREASLYR